MKEIQPDFGKSTDGLVPVIVQDSSTSKVLMLGYMNEESFRLSRETSLVTFYSRSKKRIWKKGEESGNVLHIKEILLDCDKDALLIKAEPQGPTCHTGADTCWNEKNEGDFLYKLAALIQSRKNADPSSSYTAALLAKGINKVAQKVGEEAVELVIEAKDSNDELFMNEAADLMYHYLVLLAAKGKTLEDVVEVLKGRGE
jgi:phosphoribosyl-AMP cyclohydrolase / phosphoribosyl-ATP pyrophosphohydrolase